MQLRDDVLQVVLNVETLRLEARAAAGGTPPSSKGNRPAPPRNGWATPSRQARQVSVNRWFTEFSGAQSAAQVG